ncbi:metal-dependent transcriptional regulator [Aestuariimicrobium sp. T2.26MG-19.2B]|uniref:metal-dependent transcriptional regulator n=1 Tax=Aestuariimicrobium sp. T2.26MG-19.2B TaxID=3040679 RepID=UPI0024777A8F|nr:metal-dependent transcriptional regulator [Aestuariimicrobium sp. T2.26MG-19.2B]CAI9400930.1 Iron-dependent repressor IdeR [Aestuariimicrobium sp. T2.26MG-19.2B]
MSELIDTTEMYLRTVYELIEEGIPPLRARIAERLHQSGPTVSQTVARMERDGLLHVADDRRILLSDQGHHLAVAVMRKHRLAERLLTDVIGLDWQLVHDEACRWEHVISDEVEARLVSMLGDLTESPYGNPIPGLVDLGLTSTPEDFREDNVPLHELVPASGEVQVRLVRMSEHVQAEAEVLSHLAEAGVRPGVTMTVRLAPYGYTLLVGEHECEVAPTVAEGLFVRPV